MKFSRNCPKFYIFKKIVIFQSLINWRLIDQLLLLYKFYGSVAFKEYTFSFLPVVSRLIWGFSLKFNKYVCGIDKNRQTSIMYIVQEDCDWLYLMENQLVTSILAHAVCLDTKIKRSSYCRKDLFVILASLNWLKRKEFSPFPGHVPYGTKWVTDTLVLSSAIYQVNGIPTKRKESKSKAA